ncbi:glycoside hydrolase family 15 protein [Halorussus salinisoli]|uniref:glycoside hydrolase family 15 protein n=1 Tax=Halorussus salinisoli TaxID=2558242 RepID=UPI0010C1C7EC|nr:glycoside hydrolase family 15 protein [Halorussus salinisoli]
MTAGELRPGGSYAPLESYGVVGNLETAALVADDGSIDWFPFPHVESPSVFAAILDADRGGRFAVRPTVGFESEQRYRERSNVLETTVRTAGGRATVTDFMPVVSHDYSVRTPRRAMYRRVSGDAGEVSVRVSFAPAFDYARTSPSFERTDADGRVDLTVRATGTENDPTLLLSGATDGTRTDAWEFEIRDDEVRGTATVAAGETKWLILSGDGPPDDASPTPVRPADLETVLAETDDYWRRWAHDCPDESACVFGGPWHDEVVRSGLTLKLLAHDETGAIAAAPTTSLPEDIGGVRNWDYRYSWIRDAAFTAQAFYNLGHEDEAKVYLSWFLELCDATDPENLQPLYGLHGDSDLDERLLEHLSGYRDSAPVRVGNAAEDQLQLDIYGEILDAVYEISRYGLDVDEDDWEAVRAVVDYVCEVWDRPDEGIWEVRCDPQQFVYSKVMCWVGLDRGIEMLDNGGFDGPREKWASVREEIRETVLDRGYDEEIGSFARSFDGENLDATGLLLPIIGFLPFDDDRVQGTIDATIDRLVTDRGLVHRYEGEDGLPGDEGAFLLCSFWLVDALALSGRTGEARDRFESVLEYASSVGLLAEEVDPRTGSHLGNTPQAFSHIGLVNSALYLGRTAGREQKGPEPKGVQESSAVPEDEE